MPPRGHGPRLWFREARRDERGRVSHPGVWTIRDDGGYSKSTRCGVDDRAGAERALASYLASKHVEHAGQGQRRPDQVAIASVLALYARDVGSGHARPRETAQRIKALIGFFGDKRLSQINGALCRGYAKSRSSDASARRELEDLRAAVNHYQAEGHIREKIAIRLPRRREARDRWLERAEAAKLIRRAWRHREKQNYAATNRYTRRHVARFIIVGLYAGRRAGAITEAAFRQMPGRGFVDVDRGLFLPASRRRQSKKRQPPIPLPRRLIAHMRRWKRAGQTYVVEWNGQPISRIGRAFRANARDCGLRDVTPHTLRHTSATWMMQRAANPWEAAGYLGMSIETLTRTYGHHHPDHLKGAWSVFDRAGGTPKPKPPRKAAHARKQKRRTTMARRSK